MNKLDTQNPVEGAIKDMELVMKQEKRMAAGFLAKSSAQHTARNYRVTWKDYEQWCEERGFEMFPGTVEQVQMWLASLGDGRYKAATIKAKFSALRKLYEREVGFKNVTKAYEVRRVLEGIIRELGVRPERVKAVGAVQLRDIIAELPRSVGSTTLTTKGRRDKALMLISYAAAFRVSEVLGLDWCDAKFESAGVVLDLRRNKTDQRAKGQWVAVFKGKREETCPVRALRSWQKVCDGGLPMFQTMDRWGKVLGGRLSESGARLVVKAGVESIGLDSERYSFHSLRSGILTDLISGGMSSQKIMRRSRHKDAAMLRVYDRPEKALEGVNYSEVAGL